MSSVHLIGVKQAGVGPEDISVAEVHDAAAFGEILQSECLGFAPFGGGLIGVEEAVTCITILGKE